MSKARTLLLVAIGALAFAACGDNSTNTAATTPPTEVMVEATDAMTESTEVMTEATDAMTESTEVMTEATDAMTEGTDAMVELPAWMQLTLTDVDGAAFTLADFMGKPVFVENFATWCPNCKQQLGTTDDAAAELGADAVFIALSVETDLSAGDVAEYAADNGFTHVRFAVMTPEFLAAISDAYGNSSINPPSTPHFIIDRHSVAGELTTGFEEAADIVEALHTAAM
ncbi:MAG: TlpA disulfide reductase family protein [Ilumatobacteraceae bacterium]